MFSLIGKAMDAVECFIEKLFCEPHQLSPAGRMMELEEEGTIRGVEDEHGMIHFYHVNGERLGNYFEVYKIIEKGMK